MRHQPVELPTVIKDWVSVSYQRRWSDFRRDVKHDLRILLLIAVCWTPTMGIYANIRTLCTLLLIAFATFVIAYRLIAVAGTHLSAGMEAWRWAECQGASPRGRLLAFLFPGSLMRAWWLDYRQSDRV